MKLISLNFKYRRTFHRRRYALRGYRKIVRGIRPFLILEAITGVETVKFDLQQSRLSNSLRDLGPKTLEKRIRQRIFDRFYRRYWLQLYYSLGRKQAISIPIPKAWAVAFSEKGIEVRVNECKIKFFLSTFLFWLGGVRRLTQLCVRNVTTGTVRDVDFVFMNLTTDNIPGGNIKSKYDFVSWFLDYTGLKIGDVNLVVQLQSREQHKYSGDIEIVADVFPKQAGLVPLFGLLIRGMKSIVIAFFGIFVGQWWRAILLVDEIEAEYMASLSDTRIADNYLFNNSRWYDKPLWTEIVEKRGSNVTCYFNATNIQSFDFGNGLPPEVGGLNLMSWKNVLVWDECQQHFIERYLPNVRSKKAGYIDFSDNGEKISSSNTMLKIAVFDVVPVRPVVGLGVGIGLGTTYYTEDVFRQFLKDISEMVSLVTGISLLYKSKKNIQEIKSVSRGTRMIWERVFDCPNIERISGGVGAGRLIDQCDAVISMPFTSTAIIGHIKKKPSIYYDPTGEVSDPCDRGLLILKSRESLIEWARDLVSNSV